MCFSSSPDMPDAPEPPAEAPKKAESRVTSAGDKTRRKAAGGAQSNTILTSSSGAQGSANTQQNTLLGT